MLYFEPGECVALNLFIKKKLIQMYIVLSAQKSNTFMYIGKVVILHLFLFFVLNFWALMRKWKKKYNTKEIPNQLLPIWLIIANYFEHFLLINLTYQLLLQFQILSTITMYTYIHKIGQSKTVLSAIHIIRHLAQFCFHCSKTCLFIMVKSKTVLSAFLLY